MIVAMNQYVTFRLDTEVYAIDVGNAREIELAPSAIEEPPRLGTRCSTRYVEGMGRRGDAVFVVLDAHKVLSRFEFNIARNGAESEVLALVARGGVQEESSCSG